MDHAVLFFIAGMVVGSFLTAASVYISQPDKYVAKDDPFASAPSKDDLESWRHCSQCSWYFYGKTKIQAWSPIRGAVIQGGLCPGCNAIRNFVPPREQ